MSRYDAVIAFSVRDEGAGKWVAVGSTERVPYVLVSHGCPQVTRACLCVVIHMILHSDGASQ